MIAYRASRTYPFVLVVELDKERALANWQQEAGNTFKIIGAVLLAALALAGLYFVRFERLARKQELDQEQLRIAAIAFESQEGMIITDAKAVVLRVNQAFTTITGYSAGESVGRDMNFLKSGKHSPQFYAAIRSSVESTGAFAGEILNRQKDGTIHPHFLGITAVYGDDCKVSHYVATLTDITTRKSAEESLLTLSRAVEQSPVSIVITDPGGRIEYVNPRFETATGYLLSEIIGETRG
ncbi:MAG: PAS domain S-box protein [Dechloromonas sp.]|uniref:PAS domain S-box protein n=1 Tax=Candidatus Dechloromonas phosphorivorans TaxID=2899244 RepID=A0A935MWU1_9RHOO|nr:PAS domain S-box protein [Candidatus Dechloromonas phosphorivorans]